MFRACAYLLREIITYAYTNNFDWINTLLSFMKVEPMWTPNNMLCRTTYNFHWFFFIEWWMKMVWNILTFSHDSCNPYFVFVSYIRYLMKSVRVYIRSRGELTSYYINRCFDQFKLFCLFTSRLATAGIFVLNLKIAMFLML